MALNRPLAGLLLLAGAAGGPYVLFETEAGKSARQGAASLAGVSSVAGSSSDGEFGRLASAGAAQIASGPSGFWNANGLDPEISTMDPALFEQAPLHALRDVLRFDVSPTWVTQNFARVSTVLADTQLDGLRVPLITGTNHTDIAGTLTYYFDHYKRVQRVTVHGVTGDPSRFVAELQHAYQLQQHPSLGGNLYMLKWNGRPTSVVYAALAPVITADAPYARYNVLIELNQPGLAYGLSAEAKQLIDMGQGANRWQ